MPMHPQNKTSERARTTVSPNYMKITDEQFDRAFAIFQEFGLRDIPVEERWHHIRDVEPTEFTALRARCEEIEDFAVGLAEKVRVGQITDEAARCQLAETYPFLAHERLARTWSQAIYFTMK
jgi:hypothetical protein